MAKDLKSRIENDFTYHRPPAEKAQDFVALREKAKELANLFLDLVPAGREQASALTSLEVAVFHANAGIARQFPVEAVAGVADPAPKEPEAKPAGINTPEALAELENMAAAEQPAAETAAAPQHPGRIVV